VLQPALLEGGPQGMIHLARFKDFGDTVPQALMHMASYPGKAFLTLFIPQVKQTTWLTTLGAYGFLPFLAPETFILMLPNLMERFLSDKREMWGLGFHYSVVWVSLSAYASLVAVHRLEKCLKYIADLFQLEKTQRMFRFTISFWLLLTWLGSMRYAPSTPEFKSRDKKYFSTATQIPINKKAVEMIPSQAKVVAQNHFLPFLAFRQFVWQPQNKFFSKAEYAILNPTESAWPHNKAHIKRWIVRLYRDSQWTLVFSEGTTVIFKKGRFEEVEPSLELFRSLPQLKKGPKVPNN